jgi:hypothetical protein
MESVVETDNSVIGFHGGEPVRRRLHMRCDHPQRFSELDAGQLHTEAAVHAAAPTSASQVRPGGRCRDGGIAVGRSNVGDDDEPVHMTASSHRGMSVGHASLGPHSMFTV